MLKTLFIVSGGKNIGSGHINRCELLSNELKEKNFLFIGIKKQKFDKIKNNLNYEIQRFNKKSIKKILDVCKKYNINRVILDHTNTNLLIQKALFNKYFLVIFDNQQKISFMSDVLINANPNVSSLDFKKRIKNKNIALLLGNKYSVIKLPPKRLNNRKFDSVFFCFGGGNDKNVLLNFLKFIKKKNLSASFDINLIIGPMNENYQKYKKYIKNNNIKNVNIFFNPRNIYEIMKRCFFAVISPGTLFYELSYFKKPTYLIYLNKKQKNLALSWSKGNLITGFQSFKSNDFNKIIENMHLFKNKKKKFIAKKLNYGDNSKKIILKINKIYRSLNE